MSSVTYSISGIYILGVKGSSLKVWNAYNSCGVGCVSSISLFLQWALQCSQSNHTWAGRMFDVLFIPMMCCSQLDLLAPKMFQRIRRLMEEECTLIGWCCVYCGSVCVCVCVCIDMWLLFLQNQVYANVLDSVGIYVPTEVSQLDTVHILISTT